MSLDGYIADSNGAYDWIVEDATIDFVAFLKNIGTLLMGRGTWEVLAAQDGGPSMFEGMDIVVVSTTMRPDADPRVRVISEDVVEAVRDLKEAAARDVWLFGGGVLFRSMLEARLVDRVELGVVPVLLGQGIPVLPGLDGRAQLAFHSSETFPSGILLLKYDVVPAAAASN